jgi:hypothetical protein
MRAGVAGMLQSGFIDGATPWVYDRPMSSAKNKVLCALFLCTAFAVELAGAGFAVADNSSVPTDVDLQELTNSDLLVICKADPSRCLDLSYGLGREAILELARIQIERKTYCKNLLLPQMKTKQDIVNAGLAYIKKNQNDPKGQAVRSFMSAIAPADPCQPQ